MQEHDRRENGKRFDDLESFRTRVAPLLAPTQPAREEDEMPGVGVGNL